ncbi:hypothetical protein SELMODRAFT_73481 [Selaginella moellendorffii]|uniref:Bulb-type lectin domain-containing protein n=1 Tax=Selaginella moellendorffii TaxID=88036 RepID=D8QMI7_SELML|nr:hypothetical protein SELMODRAFT_73481 [Selaginella moellendorffii]
MYVDHFLVSSNGKNIFILKSNCNIMFYSSNKLLWESNTSIKNVNNCFLTLQFDGNLVMYYDNKSLWATNTFCKNQPNCIFLTLFTIQNDCNFIVYTSKFPNVAIWTSGTKDHVLCSY